MTSFQFHTVLSTRAFARATRKCLRSQLRGRAGHDFCSARNVRNGKPPHELGGPSSSYADLAAAIGDATGTTVVYRDLPVGDYREALLEAGTPEGLAAFLAETDAGIAQGALDTSSPSLQQLLGRTPGTFADTLRSSRA